MKDPSPPGIRLLGELQLVGCDGRAVALPASRKTRALLGYLIATGQPHRRERLCDLLWDGPDDPRAELRWSLSKIWAVLDDEEGMRLTADRERVGVELGNAVIDIQRLRSLLGDGVSAARIAALKEAASLLGVGEFLDGLDLPLCYRYQEWCMAEREAVSRLHLAVLTVSSNGFKAILRTRWPMRAPLQRPTRCPSQVTRRLSGCWSARAETRRRLVITNMQAGFSKPSSACVLRPNWKRPGKLATDWSASVAAKRPARASVSLQCQGLRPPPPLSAAEQSGADRSDGGDAD